MKIALDARKLNESCLKKRPHIPIMEELLNQISADLSKNDHDPIWISVIDLDYAYGQMKLAHETSKHCNFAMTGEKINRYYRFLKEFYDPAGIPTIFQEKIERTLGHQTPVSLDDSIIVTRGTKEEHTQKLNSVLTKLEDEGYRVSQKKLYQKETIWLRHTISQDGIKPNTAKTRGKQARTKNKHQDTQVLPRSNTVFCKIHTEPVRKNGQYETIAQERNKMGMDHRSKFGL